jgi:hypothetical protein
MVALKRLTDGALDLDRGAVMFLTLDELIGSRLADDLQHPSMDALALRGALDGVAPYRPPAVRLGGHDGPVVPQA